MDKQSKSNGELAYVKPNSFSFILRCCCCFRFRFRFLFDSRFRFAFLFALVSTRARRQTCELTSYKLTLNIPLYNSLYVSLSLSLWAPMSNQKDGRLKCQNVQTSSLDQADLTNSIINPRAQRSTWLDSDPFGYEQYDSNELDDSTDLESNSDLNNSAARDKRHTEPVCPSIDCKADQQIRFNDDCCTYCKDFDFCARAKLERLCHKEAHCSTNNASLELASGSQSINAALDCKCKHGFRGDGRSCSDIDECLEPDLNLCDPRSTNCVNTAGGFECKCKPGFKPTQPARLSDSHRGAQTKCIDVDECTEPKLNKCHKEADCINLPGSFKCRCRLGFLGNGYECFKWVQPTSSTSAAYIHRHSNGDRDSQSKHSINDINSDEDSSDSDSSELDETFSSHEDPTLAKLSDSKWEPLSFDWSSISQQVSLQTQEIVVN